MNQLSIPEFEEHNGKLEEDVVFEVALQEGQGKTTQICAKTFASANKYAKARATSDVENGFLGRAYIVRPIPYLRG